MKKTLDSEVLEISLIAQANQTFVMNLMVWVSFRGSSKCQVIF